ncbi:hypothetical protein BJ508DRAFT_304722 [Ascobolus immersus RN42]|uniref:F-box domain-containing protein n=1 Tax=Ascobolus immersus RN42 TaxID=1160509 RepID=A0A3N4IBR2_ASCIM|nr:hypothetical protein BJ508DRAFT_304722 [Ascobolus immersus RN42]
MSQLQPSDSYVERRRAHYRALAGWPGQLGPCPWEYRPHLARDIWRRDFGSESPQPPQVEGLIGHPAGSKDVSCPGETSDIGCTQQQYFRLMDLPYEIIHEVCTSVESPLSFISLALVCQDLKTITRSSYTSRAFSQKWIDTHCNGTRSLEIIEFIVRFLHRHCIPPHTCTHREARFYCPAGGNVDLFFEGTFIVDELPCRLFFYSTESSKMDFLNFLGDVSAVSAERRQRLFQRIASKDLALSSTSSKQSLVPLSSLRLDIEDAVLAFEIWRFLQDYHYFEPGPFEQSCAQSTLTNIWEGLRSQKWDCRCGNEQSVFLEQPSGPKCRKTDDPNEGWELDTES